MCSGFCLIDRRATPTGGNQCPHARDLPVSLPMAAEAGNRTNYFELFFGGRRPGDGCGSQTKSGGGPPHSKTLARMTDGSRTTRSVLECGSPLALSPHHAASGSNSSATETLSVLNR